jgi:hypothetical protein
MNVRSLVAVALLLPVVASAQRRGGGGRIGGGRVAPPVALPPTSGVIAREMSYVRLPISTESYLFMSFVNAPTGATMAFTNFGSLNAATRADFRLNRYFSATADLTQSLFGGPASMGSLELGTRFHPSPADNKMRAYLDARLGYMYSYETYLYSPDPTVVNPSTMFRNRFGRGFGIIGGFGSEYSLTRTLSLTSGFWATRNRLQTRTSNYLTPASPLGSAYTMTSTRFSLGVKWNPMKAVPVDRP